MLLLEFARVNGLMLIKGRFSSDHLYTFKICINSAFLIDSATEIGNMSLP